MVLTLAATKSKARRRITTEANSSNNASLSLLAVLTGSPTAAARHASITPKRRAAYGESVVCIPMFSMCSPIWKPLEVDRSTRIRRIHGDTRGTRRRCP